MTCSSSLLQVGHAPECFSPSTIHFSLSSGHLRPLKHSLGGNYLLPINESCKRLAASECPFSSMSIVSQPGGNHVPCRGLQHIWHLFFTCAFHSRSNISIVMARCTARKRRIGGRRSFWNCGLPSHMQKCLGEAVDWWSGIIMRLSMIRLLQEPSFSPD